MKLHFLASGILCLLASPLIAQVEDATDLSRYEIFEEGQNIETLASLEEKENQYLSAVAEDGCEVALPLIIDFATSANRLSNLIRRGIEPYYDARRDDQDQMARNRSLLQTLASAENVSNSLIRQRNKAWVEEAKCLIALGDDEEATNRLYRALDYISHDETELWEEARELIWEQVGFDSE